MPGSTKPQDAASTRKLERGPRDIRAKVETYPIRREPGRMPGSTWYVAVKPKPAECSLTPAWPGRAYGAQQTRCPLSGGG